MLASSPTYALCSASAVGGATPVRTTGVFLPLSERPTLDPTRPHVSVRTDGLCGVKQINYLNTLSPEAQMEGVASTDMSF